MLDSRCRRGTISLGLSPVPPPAPEATAANHTAGGSRVGSGAAPLLAGAGVGGRAGGGVRLGGGAAVGGGKAGGCTGGPAPGFTGVFVGRLAWGATEGRG